MMDFLQIFENENTVSPRLTEWWSAVQKRSFIATFRHVKHLKHPIVSKYSDICSLGVLPFNFSLGILVLLS